MKKTTKTRKHASMTVISLLMMIILASMAADGFGESNTASESLQERVSALEEQVTKSKPEWQERIKINGSIMLYYFSHNNDYFGTTSSNFLESTAKLGVEATLTDKITSQFQLTAEGVVGDAVDFTGVTSDGWNVEPDLVNITYHKILDTPLSITVGRQNLEYGDGFLVCDGYTDKKAVWTGSIRSFYAVKGVYQMDNGQIDAFAAMVDEDYESYESFLTDFTPRTGRRYLYGTNVHLEKSGRPTLDLAAFYKVDKSVLESDTLALSQRGSHTFDPWPESANRPQIILEGEIVEQFGSTNVNNNALTDSNRDRQAFGGHLDVGLNFARTNYTPHAKVRYIYLPGDGPGSSKNKAFDPMFYGYKDWGRWFIGDINSFNLFNYNQKTLMGEIGMYPSASTSLKGQYFYTELDKELVAGAGKKWSHEVNIIFDWYPNEWFYAGAEFGYAHPLDAAEAFMGTNKDTTVFMLWAGVQY